MYGPCAAKPAWIPAATNLCRPKPAQILPIGDKPSKPPAANAKPPAKETLGACDWIRNIRLGRLPSNTRVQTASAT